jgi:hypothetical protein
MRQPTPKDLRLLEQVTAEVEVAARRAARQALLDHKRTGDPIIVFRDGEVRSIPANEIRIPPLGR